ncbi:hypothetical protein C8Q78DRAFT_1056194 [Trametes maxima]|nr:hypothetical protein C8Q78DRAFT_1056194 [Trametes maxima]
MPPPPSLPSTTVVGASSAPAFGPQVALVAGLGLLLASFCLGFAIVFTRRYRRALRAETKRRFPTAADLEYQDYGCDDNEKCSRFLPFSRAATSRYWSSSAFGSGPPAPGNGLSRPSLPALAFAPSSRLRDSVLCRALGGLPPADLESGKHSSRRGIDVEADTGLGGKARTQPRPLNPLVPKIVIQSCNDDPATDSPASVYSTDSSTDSTSSSVFDTPPPMTPTLASPISFYFPTSPSFSAHDYLQVPPPSCHAPREEDKPVTRNVSNVSRQTFLLAAPPIAHFSKVGKSMLERRMAARAAALASRTIDGQPQSCTRPSGLRVVRGCGVGPRLVGDSTPSSVHGAQGGVTGLGLTLGVQHKQDLLYPQDSAPAASLPIQEGERGSSHVNNAPSDPDLANTFERPLTTNVVVSTTAAGHDNADADAVDDVTGRPDRLARLVEALDWSFSPASVDGGRSPNPSRVFDGYFPGGDDVNLEDKDDYADSAVFPEDIVVYAI